MRGEWVFFDLDGTLVDHEAAADAAVDVLGARFADVLGRLGQEELRARWRSLQDQWFGEYLHGRLTFHQQRAARVRGLWASVGVAPPTDLDVAVIFDTYLSAYEAAWSLFPDVLSCLDRLDEHRVGVVTNGDRDQQVRKIRACGLDGRFDVIIASSEVGASKPAPAIFLEAARRARVEPERCVYVGDRLESDAVAAAGVGMHGVWVDRCHMAGEHVPPTVTRITTLHDLMA